MRYSSRTNGGRTSIIVFFLTAAFAAVMAFSVPTEEDHVLALAQTMQEKDKVTNVFVREKIILKLDYSDMRFFSTGKMKIDGRKRLVSVGLFNKVLCDPRININYRNKRENGNAKE